MSEMKNLKYVIGPYKVRPSTLHSYTLHTHTQGSFFGDIVLYLGNGLIIRYKYLIIPESQHTHNSHIILPGLPDYTYLIWVSSSPSRTRTLDHGDYRLIK